MNFLIDAVMVAIAVACCVWGFKNGFVRMVVHFFKNIIALIVASVFTSRVGALLYQQFFKNIFENMTTKKIASWLGVDTSATLDIGPLIDAEHSEFFGFVKKLGFNFDAINEKYAELGGESGDLMVEYISKPLGVTVSNVVAFALIFVVTVLAIQIIGFIIGKIAKLPVLNVTNRVLGLLLGAVLGIIFLFVFVAIVKVLVPYIKLDGEYLTVGALEEGTIIYKYLVNKTPAGFIEDILVKIGVK